MIKQKNLLVLALVAVLVLSMFLVPVVAQGTAYCAEDPSVVTAETHDCANCVDGVATCPKCDGQGTYKPAESGAVYYYGCVLCGGSGYYALGGGINYTSGTGTIPCVNLGVPSTYTVTYLVENRDMWVAEGYGFEAKYTVTVASGKIIPSMKEKFGSAYGYLSWDKAGLDKVESTEKVDSDKTIYVHLNSNLSSNEYVVTYHLHSGGLFGKWEPALKLAVKYNDGFPNVAENFGEYVTFYTLDKAGKSPLASDSFVTSNTDVYVHLNEPKDKLKVEVFTLDYKVGEVLDYGLNLTFYVDKGSLLNVMPSNSIVSIESGQKIVHKFQNFSSDKAGKDVVPLKSEVSKDLTLYAQYENYNFVKPVTVGSFLISVWNFFMSISTGIGLTGIAAYICSPILIVLTLAAVVAIVKFVLKILF